MSPPMTVFDTPAVVIPSGGFMTEAFGAPPSDHTETTAAGLPYPLPDAVMAHTPAYLRALRAAVDNRVTNTGMVITPPKDVHFDGQGLADVTFAGLAKLDGCVWTCVGDTDDSRAWFLMMTVGAGSLNSRRFMAHVATLGGLNNAPIQVAANDWQWFMFIAWGQPV